MLKTQNNDQLINVLSNLQKDDKITIVGLNDFGFPQVSQTRYHSHEIKENYSQQFIYMIHKPKRKRTHYKKSLENNSIIILKGWHDIGTNNQYKTYNSNGITYQESIYTSFDDTFLKEIALLWGNETLFQNVL